jgi:hypothetical protein
MNMMTDQKKTTMNRIGQCGRILPQRFRPPVFFLAILPILDHMILTVSNVERGEIRSLAPADIAAL